MDVTEEALLPDIDGLKKYQDCSIAQKMYHPQLFCRCQ